jgi:hypothetical protein
MFGTAIVFSLLFHHQVYLIGYKQRPFCPIRGRWAWEKERAAESRSLELQWMQKPFLCLNSQADEGQLSTNRNVRKQMP